MLLSQDNPKYVGCEPNEAIPTMVQIPLESNRLQVVVMKPNKVLPKEALVALSPEYFHNLWLPSADQNLKTVKLRMPKERCECHFHTLIISLFTNSLYVINVT